MRRSDTVRRDVAGALLLALATSLGCAALHSPPPGELALEVFSGAVSPVRWPEPGPVVLVLDRSRSMRIASEGAPSRFETARAAARRFAGSLPESVPVALWTIGDPASPACSVAPLAAAEGAGHPHLIGALETLRSGGEGGIDQALGEVRRALERDGVAARTRVVVFTDLGAQCGGDVCTAARALVDAGASLDWVLVGDAEAPDCDLGSKTVAGAPEPVRDAMPAAAPGFRAQRVATEERSGDAETLAGVAGGPPLRLAPGEYDVVVEFDPPARVGPLAVRSGQRTRLRILHFPAAPSPVHEWHVDSSPLAEPGSDTPR